jgi:hypothetical protein
MLETIIGKPSNQESLRAKRVNSKIKRSNKKMGSQAATPTAPAAVTVKKVYKYFHLDTFAEVSENAEVTFTPPADYGEAMQRIGNDSGVVLKAVTAYLQRAAFNEKRKEIAGKGASKKIVLGVIKPLRNLPPWSGMESDRKAQTESLLQMVKANPVMVEAIKAASIEAANADDDDEQGDDE